MNEETGRAHLAAAVRADRMRLYRTVDRARIAADVSRGTWEKVEAGERVRDFTLGAIEEALHWPVGRAQRIVEGSEGVDSSERHDDLRQQIISSDEPSWKKRALLALLDAEGDEGPNDPPGNERGAG